MKTEEFIVTDDPLNPREAVSDADIARLVDWWNAIRLRKSKDVVDVPLIVRAPPDADN